MKEVRITLGSDDFAAVTKHMIELGVRFQVEPISTDDDAAVLGATPAQRRRETKSKPAKAARRSAAAEPESPAAARLRAMAERNRAASGRSGDDAREPGEGGQPGAASPFDET